MTEAKTEGPAVEKADTCSRCGIAKPEHINHLWACCGDGPGYGDHIKPETVACLRRQLEAARAELATAREGRKHLEEAAELLRRHVELERRRHNRSPNDTGQWMLDYRAWQDRDQHRAPAEALKIPVEIPDCPHGIGLCVTNCPRQVAIRERSKPPTSEGAGRVTHIQAAVALQELADNALATWTLERLELLELYRQQQVEAWRVRDQSATPAEVPNRGVLVVKSPRRVLGEATVIVSAEEPVRGRGVRPDEVTATGGVVKPAPFAEAEGRVDHILARDWVGFINRDEVAIRTALLRYIDQQEAAEREAVELRKELERTKLDFTNSCDVGRRLEAKLSEAERKLARLHKLTANIVSGGTDGWRQQAALVLDEVGLSRTWSAEQNNALLATQEPTRGEPAKPAQQADQKPCHCWPYNSKGEHEHDSSCPSAEKPAQAEQKDPDPRLWFVVEGHDGSYSTCQTETEARELLKHASEGSFTTRTRPNPAGERGDLRVGQRVQSRCVIVVQPGRCGGSPTLGNTRLPLRQFVAQVRAGWTDEQLHENWEYVPQETWAVVRAIAAELSVIPDDDYPTESDPAQPQPQGDGVTKIWLLEAVREAYQDKRSRAFDAHIPLALLAEVIERKPL